MENLVNNYLIADLTSIVMEYSKCSANGCDNFADAVIIWQDEELYLCSCHADG